MPGRLGLHRSGRVRAAAAGRPGARNKEAAALARPLARSSASARVARSPAAPSPARAMEDGRKKRCGELARRVTRARGRVCAVCHRVRT